jgi:sugar phosphate permease
MLALYFCANAIGIVSGYYIISVVREHFGFQYGFLVPSILTLFPCSVLFLILDKKHFQKGSKFVKEENADEIKMSLFNSESLLNSKTIIHDKEVKILKIVGKLIKNGRYIFLVLTVINMYFILYGLQTWTTKYGIIVLRADKEIVTLGFILTVGAGPPLGYLIGGLITTKIFGSYTNPKVIKMVFFIQVIRLLVCIPGPLMNTWWTYFASLWLSTFTEGLLIPTLVGMIINTVPP